MFLVEKVFFSNLAAKGFWHISLIWKNLNSNGRSHLSSFNMHLLLTFWSFADEILACLATFSKVPAFFWKLHAFCYILVACCAFKQVDGWKIVKRTSVDPLVSAQLRIVSQANPSSIVLYRRKGNAINKFFFLFTRYANKIAPKSKTHA